MRTQQGEKAIGKLHVGDKVLAYNPKTHKMEQEPILHVWINHDTDLVDLTLTTTTATGHGKAATKMSETIHTNKEHPFLTKEKGFLPVSQIKLGMHVLRADGTYGVVTGWKVMPGTQVMYNLEVAQDHTFTVGDGQWVVHNTCRPGPDRSRNQVSKIVRSLARMTDLARAAEGTARMQRGGPATPNYAGIGIEADGLTPFGQVFKSLNADYGVPRNIPNYHAEYLGIDYAEAQLNGLSARGVVTDYNVTLVTQYWPCNACEGLIESNNWLNRLLAAANGGKVNLEIWHYTDWGVFRQVLPGQP